jgi:hypothetical protein
MAVVVMGHLCVAKRSFLLAPIALIVILVVGFSRIERMGGIRNGRERTRWRERAACGEGKGSRAASGRGSGGGGGGGE